MNYTNTVISDGMSLDKQQRVVEKLIALFNTNEVKGIDSLPGYLAPALYDMFREDNFLRLRQSIRGRFGVLQEMRFASYERLDQCDRLTYVAKYSREPIMRMVYEFDNEDRLKELFFIPLNIKAIENK